MKDQEYAFPQKEPLTDDCQGMTLRDYFAAKAMAALVIGNNADVSSISIGTVKDAYMLADLMLQEREK